MNLIKEKWNKNDGKELTKYLLTFRNKDREQWSKNLLNTKMDVLSIPTPIIKNIVKEIALGNYLSLLDLNINTYFENTSINGSLITKIKDFDLMKYYLDKYVSQIDNWASCDLLSFNVKGNEEKYYSLVLEYIKSNLPFVRRVGLSILFKFIDNDLYINKIFDILNMFYYEEEYYVNMMIAWLFCECFIKRRDNTIKFLKNHKLNKFSINKGISKCRDSYRVSIEDKELLLKYKIK